MEEKFFHSDASLNQCSLSLVGFQESLRPCIVDLRPSFDKISILRFAIFIFTSQTKLTELIKLQELLEKISFNSTNGVLGRKDRPSSWPKDLLQQQSFSLRNLVHNFKIS